MLSWELEETGIPVDQIRRIKEVEQENQRLRNAASDLSLDKQILKEAIEGKM